MFRLQIASSQITYISGEGANELVCFAEEGGYVNDRTDGLTEFFLLATMPAKFSEES